MQKERKMHNFERFPKAKVTLQFSFRKRERVENTQQISFQKAKDFATLLKCTNSKQKQKQVK